MQSIVNKSHVTHTHTNQKKHVQPKTIANKTEFEQNEKQKSV